MIPSQLAIGSNPFFWIIQKFVVHTIVNWAHFCSTKNRWDGIIMLIVIIFQTFGWRHFSPFLFVSCEGFSFEALFTSRKCIFQKITSVQIAFTLKYFQTAVEVHRFFRQKNIKILMFGRHQNPVSLNECFGILSEKIISLSRSNVLEMHDCQKSLKSFEKNTWWHCWEL